MGGVRKPENIRRVVFARAAVEHTNDQRVRQARREIGRIFLGACKVMSKVASEFKAGRLPKIDRDVMTVLQIALARLDGPERRRVVDFFKTAGVDVTKPTRKKRLSRRQARRG